MKRKNVIVALVIGFFLVGFVTDVVPEILKENEKVEKSIRYKVDKLLEFEIRNNGEMASIEFSDLIYILGNNDIWLSETDETFKFGKVKSFLKNNPELAQPFIKKFSKYAWNYALEKMQKGLVYSEFKYSKEFHDCVDVPVDTFYFSKMEAEEYLKLFRKTCQNWQVEIETLSTGEIGELVLHYRLTNELWDLSWYGSGRKYDELYHHESDELAKMLTNQGLSSNGYSIRAMRQSELPVFLLRVLNQQFPYYISNEDAKEKLGSYENYLNIFVQAFPEKN